MIVLKTVLVATDFGEPSAVALTYGRELARTFGATLRVVHAAANLGGSLGAVPGFVPDFGRLQTGVEESARQRLAALLSEEESSRRSMRRPSWSRPCRPRTLS